MSYDRQWADCEICGKPAPVDCMEFHMSLIHAETRPKPQIVLVEKKKKAKKKR